MRKISKLMEQKNKGTSNRLVAHLFFRNLENLAALKTTTGVKFQLFVVKTKPQILNENKQKNEFIK